MPDNQPSQELVNALSSLINTATPSARKTALKANSELLLKPTVLNLLDKNIERYKDENDVDAVDVFQQVKYLIEKGIKEGLNASMEILDRQEIANLLNEMMQLDYPKMFKFLEEHQGFLLSPLTERILNENLERMKESEGFNHMSLINNIIKIAKNENIENSKDWFKGVVIGNIKAALKEKSYSNCEAYISIAIGITAREKEIVTKEQIGNILISECDLITDLDWIRRMINSPVLNVINKGIKTLDIFLIQRLCLSTEREHLEEGIRMFREMEKDLSSRGYKIGGFNGTIGNAYMVLHLQNRERNHEDPNLDEAIKYTELEIAGNEVNSENWRRGYRTIGEVYLLKRNPSKAIESFEKATEIEPNGIDELYADTRYALSIQRSIKSITNRKQENEKAINDLEKALKHAPRMTPLWAKINRNLGNIYREFNSGDPSKDFKKSLYHTEQAESFFTKEKYPNDWAQIQHNLGTLYSADTRGDRSANLENAIAAYKRTLEIHTKKDYPQYYGLTNCALGLAYLFRIMGNRQENLALALKHLKEAESHLDPELSGQWLGDCYNGLAGVYLTEGADTKKETLSIALEYLEKAKEIYKANGNKDREMDAMNNITKLYSDLLELDASFADNAIRNSLLVLRSVKKEDDPKRWASYVRNHAVLLFNINRATGGGTSYNEILNYLSESLTVYKEDTYLQDYHDILVTMGHIHFLRTNWEKALETYAKSIKAGETLLLSTFTEDGRKQLIKETELGYIRSAYCLVKIGRSEEAVLMIEAAKARLLGETLIYSSIDDTSIPDSTRKKLSELQEKINRLEYRMRQSDGKRNTTNLAEELGLARDSLKMITEQLRQTHPYFGQRLNSFQEIVDEIPEEGALIAFLVTSAGGFVFVLPKTISKIGPANIVELPTITTESISHRLNIENPKSWVSLLNEIDRLQEPNEFFNWFRNFYGFMNFNWEIIMKAVYDRLVQLGIRQGSRLLFLPQGGLWFLALHASSWIDNGRMKSFNDDYIISYTPSLFINKICKARLLKNSDFQKKLLAIGDTVGDLPFANDEVSLIANKFSSSIVLSMEDATGKNILRQVNEASYVHFACHGNYDWSNVMHSAIVLRNNEQLELSQILSKFNLRNNRLVTLSACESGLTDLRGSADEFVGLPSGFILAGATGVFSSLWRVEDAATCLIMDALYDEMIQRNQLPAVALYNAQQRLRNLTVADISILKKPDGKKIIQRFEFLFPQLQPTDRLFDDPYFWAGFTLIGT